MCVCVCVCVSDPLAHKSWGGAIWRDVLQHSIRCILIQFGRGDLVVPSYDAQQIPYVALHLRVSVAQVEVDQLLDQLPQHQLPASLRSQSEGLEECHAVFGSGRAAPETLALVDLRGSTGERRRLRWEMRGGEYDKTHQWRKKSDKLRQTDTRTVKGIKE